MKISDARQLIQVKAPVLSRRRRVLANAFNVEEYRKSAQKVLPAGIFDYLDGGSEDEVTLRRNRAVFDSWALMPSWGPVSGPDTSTTLLGKDSALPLTLTPTGATRLFHPEGELAVAAAADRARIPYGLAGLSTVPMETIAERHPNLDRWFNFGLTSDAQALKDKLARCEAAGFNTLIVGVDTRALGSRERDLHNGFTAPPALTLSTIADIARRPAWWINFLKSDGISFPNLDPRSAAATSVVTPSMWQHILGHSDATSGWKELEALRQAWHGKIVLKGCVNPADVAKAARHRPGRRPAEQPRRPPARPHAESDGCAAGIPAAGGRLDRDLCGLGHPPGQRRPQGAGARRRRLLDRQGLPVRTGGGGLARRRAHH